MNLHLWAILAGILGLSSFVGSIPVNVVTDVPANTEGNVLREAITDGFIVDNSYFPLVVTEKPQSSNSTASGENGNPTASDEFDTMEGSGTTEGSADYSFPIYQSPTVSLVPPHSTFSTVLLKDGDAGIPNSFSTQSSDSGSGFEGNDLIAETTMSVASIVPGYTTALSTSTAGGSFTAPHEEKDDNEQLSRSGIITLNSALIKSTDGPPVELIPSKQKGQNTPGWMIIVGFVVGIAALVLLCIAIATRDKWNRPDQESLAKETKSSSDQQTAQEMEVFLERPEEVKHEEEYTVIPLNELPEKEPLP